MRPTIGVKMTAIAVAIVGTAGVAAAATVGSTPALPRPDASAAVETELVDERTVDRADLEATEVTGVPTTVPTTTVPPVPSLPMPPTLPGASTLPIDPASVTASADQAVAQVAALLPSPAQLQAVVLDCVRDIDSLAPAPPSTVTGNPLGFLTGLLGSLTATRTPSLPDPGVVQATFSTCVANVLGVVPDPAALASALTTAFGASTPAPVAALVAQLTSQLGAVPDAGSVIDLVTGLIGASGSPAAVLDQLTRAIDAVVPAPLDELVTFPLAIVNQLFATIGLT